MTALKQLESKIGGLFKSAPPLPESAKKTLVEAWPWIALIFGLLQLLVAWGLWGATRYVERISNLSNSISMYYTNASVGFSSFDRSVIYLALLILVIDGVILLMAFPHLKKRTNRGWDLLFLGSLINLMYAVVSVFINDKGISTFVLSLVGSAVGFYLLFQVKDKYHTAK